MQKVYFISSQLKPENALHKALVRLGESDRRLIGAGSARYLEYNGLHLSCFCEQILQELTFGINQGVTLRVRSSNTKQQVLQLHKVTKALVTKSTWKSRKTTMLNTKEYFKQIEMDTIQQEPLFTELTPEAAATVEGGILFTTVGVTSKLNIRNRPDLRISRVIGSLSPGQIFDATSIVRNGFRKLTTATARANTGGQPTGWVSTSFIRRV